MPGASRPLSPFLDLSVADHDVAVESAPDHRSPVVGSARSRSLCGSSRSRAVRPRSPTCSGVRQRLVQAAADRLDVLLLPAPANGVRHLFWDVGIGFDRAQIQASGWTVIARDARRDRGVLAGSRSFRGAADESRDTAESRARPRHRHRRGRALVDATVDGRRAARAARPLVRVRVC